MANLDSLEALLQEELKDMYKAEKQLTRALPKRAKKAGAAELKQALEEHLAQTERQNERLEEVFEQLGMPARDKKCKGVENLIAEGEEMLEEVDDDDIASYGTVRTWAHLLGKPEVAAPLEETLEEEKDTDQNLTSMAESFVNLEAADSEGDEDEEEEAARPKGLGTSVRQARSAAADKPATRGRSCW